MTGWTCPAPSGARAATAAKAATAWKWLATCRGWWWYVTPGSLMGEAGGLAGDRAGVRKGLARVANPAERSRYTLPLGPQRLGNVLTAHRSRRTLDTPMHELIAVPFSGILPAPA